MMVQCNYCSYETTADEYGLQDAPLHLIQMHFIDSHDNVEKHFHFKEQNEKNS